MMHIFHIKGFSGFLMFLMAALATLFLVVGLPSIFMTVLWNATVFEAFQGPEVTLFQGFLLWVIAVILIKLIFQPEIHLEFQKLEPPNDLDDNKE